MEPHISPPPRDPSGFRFPDLPIISPDAAQTSRSTRDKYGGLYFLGLSGLLIVVALVTWFAWGAWTHRAIWRNVYVLHDASRLEAERVVAAYALARDGRVNQRQYWDVSLRRSLPPLARYVLAEALTGEAVAGDPRGYALAVARSEGWPVWLRLLLARPLAYAAAQGMPLPADAMRELRDRHHDPAIDLWAEFALAASTPADGPATAALERAAATDGPNRPFAEKLLAALRSQGVERTQRLDDATLWLRSHHPAAVAVWEAWNVEAGRLVPKRSGPQSSPGSPRP
jgi:hypothetical protein